MGILISEIRVRNFRSIKSMDLVINDFCLLIGQNNVGKTSLLSAINLAFGGIRYANSEDIYVSEGEKLSKDREAIIDVLIIPVDEDNNKMDEFDKFWFEHFGDFRSEEVGTLNNFVAIRTKVAYNRVKGEYTIERKSLIQWPLSEDVERYSDYKKGRVTENLLSSIPVFYMDAQRDIVSEMKDRKSYFGKMVADVELTEEEIEEIENTLNDINESIIDKSTVLKHLTSKLEKISGSVKSSDDSIKINPVSRKIRDLNRGIDISFQDYKSESFPISRHGMGTRSWITFLTLTAYITWKLDVMNDEGQPYHPLVLIEEPEAHLHPQAQRHLLHQIGQINGQKIVSTHSSIIAGQVDINEIRQIRKVEGDSKISKINTVGFTNQEIRKIKREIMNTRGDLLFASAMILCEGETEEQAIPAFFKEYFGANTFELGINVIGVGGSGKYKPFLQIANDLNIDYFIFSDGEDKTIKGIKKDIKNVFNEDNIDTLSNIVILDNENDFESFLIQDGYADDLISIIEVLRGERYLDNYISTRDQTEKSPLKTSDICGECQQNIYKSEMRDYTDVEGHKNALLDCLGTMKTEYSSIVAKTIIENNAERKIPSKLLELFDVIKSGLNISLEGNNEN